MPISHSNDALAALKESLLAEETASKEPKSKPKLKHKKKKDIGDGEIMESVKAGKASPGAKEKSVKTNKATTATSAKPKKAPKTNKTTTPKTTQPAAQDGLPAGEELPEGEMRRTSRKTKAIPTDAQRRMIDAVLLGAKNKRAAALRKKIESHIHSIGENETREAVLKIIKDGKLSRGDAVKATQKIRSKPPCKRRLLIKKVVSKEGHGRDGRVIPLVRSIPTESPPVFRTLREAFQDAHFKTKSSVPRRPRLTRTSTRGSRKKPGENVVTGPLRGGGGFEIKTLDAADLELTPINKPQPLVPKLWYGLDRVLFNPGVYQLQDPRSRVFNFDPYLQTIMPVSEFDFTALKKYITSSRDETLLATAREEKKKYTGSTSSTTAALAHFHFLLSQWRPVNTGILSQNFPVEFNSFTALQRGPSAIFLRWKDGVYAIDADKQFDTANILSTLGKSMEKLLTLPTEDFEKYRKENSDQISLEEREAAEAFNYTTMGDFLLRSQLDAYDARLPGTGMFDLKTRAVVSIRMDTSEYEQGMDYEIRQRYGEWESFEREYYDMIRAAFLKYSLQVRMGRMDGIFVAFHNTQRIFGFQYISLPEMDLAIHGTEDTTIGDAEFKLSLELLNKVLDRASAKYPEKSLRLHFETRGTDVPFMYIFAEPMEEEQIMEIQESNKAVIEDFEKRVLGLDSEETETEKVEEELSDEEKKAVEWASMRAKVEENMEKDELDIEEARSIAESMIESSDIFGSEAISAEEKERLINELLESSAFSEVEDEEAMVLREDRDSGEDGVEGASADSEGDDVDEDEDDIGEEDEEGEENEENEVEDEQEDEEEETEEEGEEIEESESLELAADKDLLVDEAPTDNLAEEPEIEAFETLDDHKSTETADESHGETNTDADNITDTERLKPDIIENRELAPDEAILNSDTQDSAPSEESATSNPNPETATSKPSLSGAEVSATEEKEGYHTTEVLAMTLTIRNKVNGRYVDRPKKLTSKDNWTIEYALEDVPTEDRAQRLYQACKRRRARALSSAKRDDDNPWNNRYLENLRTLSRQGKEWRERQNEIDSEGPVKVLDWDQIKQQADQSACEKKDVGKDEVDQTTAGRKE